jgi:hypothetical protein
MFFARFWSTPKGTMDSGRMRLRLLSCSSTWGDPQKSQRVLMLWPPKATVAPQVLQLMVRVVAPKPRCVAMVRPACRSCSTMSCEPAAAAI